MRKNVLFADNEYELLSSLKQQFAEYQENFSIITVENGKKAIKKLSQEDISLVIANLNMPNTDGFGLLFHVKEFYPDIPVIVTAECSTPEMESLVFEAGAVGCIEKPFKIGVLAELIFDWLQHETDGGILRNVSSGMFLQLIEMEQKTCTIRLRDMASGKRGVLFFRNGELLDARINGVAKGEEAAYHIFSWDEVTLSIQNSCRCYDKNIEGSLQAILLEAMRLKDEVVVVIPTTVVDTGASESDAVDGRSKRREYRIITKLSDFVYVEFSLEMPEGKKKHYRLNVINYSKYGIGIIVPEKDFDLLNLLKKGTAINEVTFSASWAQITVDMIIRHVTKLEEGPYAGMYSVGVETRELITSAQPAQKKELNH